MKTKKTMKIELKNALIAAGIPAASIREDTEPINRGSAMWVIGEDIWAEVWQYKGRTVGAVNCWYTEFEGENILCKDMPTVVAEVLQAQRRIQNERQGQKCTIH